jgi:hypothetical protein
MAAASRRFNDLVADLHARMGARTPEGAAPGQPAPVDIVWRGVRFRMAHAPALDADSLVVQCFYGTPLHGQIPVQDILVRLLEVNLVLAVKRAGASFGMDPDSGEVAYVFIGALSEVCGASLLDAMTLAARHALHWRDTFLLGDPLHAASADAADLDMVRA